MAFPIDRVGKRYGFYRVIKRDVDRRDIGGNVYWWCECDCGTINSVRGSVLAHGHSQSCGCAKVELHKEALRKRAASNYEYEFWRRVDKSDGCWIWTGSKNQLGYGFFREKRAHRISYELNKGPIEPGLFVCHACDNPSCVNPDHLWLGRPKDNHADMVSKGRQRSGPAIFGTNHPLSKINDRIARRIRESPESGATLAKRYGISPSLVYGIKAGTHWKYA